MKIGFIGLGKMGSQMVQRILDAGHETIVFDRSIEATNAMSQKGAIGTNSAQELIEKLGENPVVWLMIPQEYVTATINELLLTLPEGSIIIDGGNSDYRNTLNNTKLTSGKNVELVDVGTSGGVHGLDNGFSMMIGGSDTAVKVVEPIFNALAQKDGWAHFGKTGAGHFIKMVHNGIEYGAMQALAEGYQILKEGPFDNLDLGKVADVWQHGSINESFLNGLSADMLKRDQEFSGVDGFVKESGEARWTLETAKELGIETPVIQAAFDVRLASQEGKTSYATKFLAQLRNEFGGHSTKKEE